VQVRVADVFSGRSNETCSNKRHDPELCVDRHEPRASGKSQQITGIVTDSTGAAIPGAEVTVTIAATGLSRTAKTNENGLYVVLNLPVGTYTISTTMQGFKKSVINGVSVDVGAKPAVPIQLAVGQVDESVEVKADTVLI
jgi:hypothetical protein